MTTKRKRKRRRINKRKLRQLRARDAEIKRYLDELRRAGVNETTLAEAAKALAVIIRNGANK